MHARFSLDSNCPPLFVALDLETTGLAYDTDTILEIGAVRFRDAQVFTTTVEECDLQQLVNPQRDIPVEITKLTGITQSMVQNAPTWNQIRDQVIQLLAVPVSHFIAHNVQFEIQFLTAQGVSLTHLQQLDTYDMVHMFMPGASRASLGVVCHRLGISLRQAHRADHDALATGQLFVRLWERMQELPDATIQQIIAHMPPDWPYQDLFQPIAYARNLSALNTNTAVTPTQVQFTRLTDIPSRPQVSETDSVDTQVVARIVQALRPATGTRLSVPCDAAHSAALAQACVQWAARDHRHLLLCLPGFHDESYQTRMLQTLQDLAQTIAPDLCITYLPHPERQIDFTRLNAWKAGRTLDPWETRFLTKILSWCSLNPSHHHHLHSLFLFAHETAVSDGHILWPLVSGTARSTPADLAPTSTPWPRPLTAPHRGGITVMVHDTFLFHLDANPDLARTFDGLVIDDSWNLFCQIPAACTRACSLYTLTYLIARIRDLAVPSSREVAGGIAAWLQSLSACDVPLASLTFHMDNLDQSLSRFIQALRGVATDMQDTNPRSQPVLRDIASLTVSTHWSATCQTWQELTTHGQACNTALDVLIEALPDIDADSVPDEARYIQQIRGWRDQLHTSMQHITQVLEPSPQHSDHDRACLSWMVLQEDAHRNEFRTTTLWTETYVRNYIRSAFDAVLFLFRNNREPPQPDFLSMQLGLQSCLQADPLPAPSTKPAFQIVVPAMSRNPEPPQVAELLSALAPQVPGHTLVLFSSRFALQQTVMNLQTTPIAQTSELLVYDHDACATISKAMTQPASKLLCGTFDLLKQVPLDNVNLQCVVVTRLPFPPRVHPIRDYQARQAQEQALSYNEFQTFVLPTTRATLTRVVDQLITPTSPRGVLVMLDSRIHKDYGKGNRQTGQPGMVATWPRATWTFPPLARTAQTVGDWLTAS